MGAELLDFDAHVEPLEPIAHLRTVAVRAESPAPEWDEPRITIKPVDVHELDEWWPLVEPAVAEVIAKNGMSATTDQVLQVLRDNRGWLGVTMWGDTIAGLSVICGDGDQFALVTDCLVWIAWTDPKNRERGIDREVREFTQRMIELAARNAGFRAIRIHCPRFGWLKVAKELGYDLQEFVFVKRLDAVAHDKGKTNRKERILRRVKPRGVISG